LLYSEKFGLVIIVIAKPNFFDMRWIIMRQPNFNNLLKVLNREIPDRHTLFEFFLNGPLYMKLAGEDAIRKEDSLDWYRVLIHAFKNAGYDYVTMQGSDFKFKVNNKHKIKSVSLNEGGVICDRKSFEEYNWPNPEDCDYSRLDILGRELPEGMKFIVWGAGGVLENVIELVGYDNLCFMLFEEPELVKDLFDEVGSRFVRYYKICAKYDSVGALIANDDWGFNTQTMISPADLRKYVFPWHKKIVEVIHNAGKPAILHSCGNLSSVMDDIIDDMKFDAKHSYEDVIMPVEEAYEKWGSRIAILGGIDVNFMCIASLEEITQRCREMLKRTASRGGYALGTGNSVPEYIPEEKYFAMINSIE
jgi:uroporphyrinogen decarboxylase